MKNEILISSRHFLKVLAVFFLFIGNINAQDSNKIHFTTPIITVTDEYNVSKYSSELEKITELKGKELQKDLGITLAATLKNESGLSVRSMGPAPSRPVYRGLSGDRISINEDGFKTNDLSGTSPDHSVTIEPFTIEKIQILRGPIILTKSSTSIGGIVNVIRNDIPKTLPEKWYLQTGFFGETVNNGLLGAVVLSVPVSNFFFRGEFSKRIAGDLKTPPGILENSELNTQNYSASLSYYSKDFYIGSAFREFKSDYGIPGGFIGAHPFGVDINMIKRQIKVKSELAVKSKFINNISFNFSRDFYNHKEFEKSGLIGAEFGIIDYSSELVLNHGRLNFIENGILGISAEFRDIDFGGYVYTPKSSSKKLSAFIYETFGFNKISFELSGRLNYDLIEPVIKSSFSNIGIITGRNFFTYSLSASAIYNISEKLHFGVSLSKSSRVPTIEELYSDGPHLASYSFDIGNPSLNSEYGFGSELFLHYADDEKYVLMTVFANDLPYYIIPRNSGDTNYSTLLPIYKTSGVAAYLIGAEATFEYNLWKKIFFEVNLGYTFGSFKNDLPLPQIPPLKGRIELSYTKQNFRFGIANEFASAQNRVDNFEQPTAGYGILNSYIQYSFFTGKFVNIISINFENIFDKEYRNHLSRVKSIMPEPGRNLRITYKMFL